MRNNIKGEADMSGFAFCEFVTNNLKSIYNVHCNHIPTLE